MRALVLAGMFAALLLPTLGQTLRREVFTGISGSTIDDLVRSSSYPNGAASTNQIDLFEAPANIGDNYGTRIRGYVTPPFTGNYIFWISGDNQCLLLLSTNDSPSHRTQIASVQGSTGVREWTREPSQQSAPIRLEAGKKYYIEALHKEGTGSDHLAVGWQLPNGTQERPIPASRISPYTPSTTAPSITLQPADTEAGEGEAVTFRVRADGKEPLHFQWQRNRVNLEGERGTNLFLPQVTRDDHGVRYRCVVSNSVGQLFSREALLTVVPERIAPRVTRVTPPGGAVVRGIDRVEVVFSEPVQGVEARDLLIRGLPAQAVTGEGSGPYIFSFPVQAEGVVTFAWAADHGITDFSLNPNAFAGGNWSCTVQPNRSLPTVRIQEFLAMNETGLVDEEGELQDWIELHNPGPDPVPLGGLSLSDDPNAPALWMLPDVVLAPGAWQIVFASGKDRVGPNGWHTNFKLGRTGFLGLYFYEFPRPALSSVAYPVQRNDHSYGQNPDGAWRYFASPTPGAPNGSSTIDTLVAPPHFSVRRGVFSQPFQLALSCPTPDATIRYTLNGSEPTASSGTVYSGPIPIHETRIVRAAAFRANALPSETVTHSYFIGLSQAQQSLPVLSLVTGTNHLTGPSGIMGIFGGYYGADGRWNSLTPLDYHNPSKHGIAWERPLSVELIHAGGAAGFQINSGIRIQGSDYMRPRYRPESKFSFRLYFRGDYGETKLQYPLMPGSVVESFDQLVLRAGHNDLNNPFIKDELMRRLFADTGQVSSRGTFVNLFVNGVYKGYYNPCERIESKFCQEWHGGGEQWDIIGPYPPVVDGDRVAWDAFRTWIYGNSMAVQENYLEAVRRFDAVNLIDYLLVNIYGANYDWPANNFRVGRERAPGAKFRYYLWDAEFAFGLGGRQPSHNTFSTELASEADIAKIYRALKESPEFRLLFADRIHRHFFNGGALTDQRIRARFDELQATMSGVIPSMDRTIPDNWIPQRRGYILGHFEQNGVYGSANAPVFSQFGGRVAKNYALLMSTSAGTIYYTTNGLDPRVAFSGIPHAQSRVYSSTSPLRINSSITVKARSRNGSTWSALTEAVFLSAELGLPLHITELMYAPAGGKAYEFIEIYNNSGSELDLSGIQLEGVTFRFPQGSSIGPFGRVVLISNDDPAAFKARYPGVTWHGTFAGTLSDTGERIALIAPNGELICSVDYRTGGGWPDGASGTGRSIERVSLAGSPDEPASWRESRDALGSPGQWSPNPFNSLVRINEVMADNATRVSHHGTFPDWVELHNASSSPQDLSGWSLSDRGEPGHFRFPPGTVLPAGGFLVVWCDSNTHLPGLHSGFKLDRSEESVFLYNAEGARVDAVTLGRQITDYSAGFFSGVDSGWKLATPTPGAANAAATLGPSSLLTINEWMANPPPGADDWFEVHNTSSTLPVSLQGLHFANSNSVYQLTACSFLGPKEYMVFKADKGVGPNHVDFKLSAGGDQIALYDPTGLLLSKVAFGVQAENLSYGRLPDGASTLTSFPQSPSPGGANYLPVDTGVVIHEFMARNHGVVQDAASRVANWIELRNTRSSAVLVGGMSLSRSVGQPREWVIPNGVSIPANGFLLVWCDPFRSPSTGQDSLLNSGFQLPYRGGEIVLWTSKNEVSDRVVYGFQVADRSCGRSPAWALLSSPTPGAENAGPAALGDPARLRINEWLAAPLGSGEWLELYNQDALPVVLSGLHLTDDPSISGQKKFTVGPLSFIGGQSWVKWEADGETWKGPEHLNFRIDAQGETLRLYSTNLTLLDAVDFGQQVRGVAQGRLPDGTGNFVALTAPTPGSQNLADTDGDGIPDTWESAHGLNPGSAADGAQDGDADGFTNLQEYQAGTDPRDPASRLALSVQLVNRLSYLAFAIPAGREFQVEQQNFSPGDNWKKVLEIEPYPFARSVILHDREGAGSSRRFYRLRVAPLR